MERFLLKFLKKDLNILVVIHELCIFAYNKIFWSFNLILCRLLLSEKNARNLSSTENTSESSQLQREHTESEKKLSNDIQLFKSQLKDLEEKNKDLLVSLHDPNWWRTNTTCLYTFQDKYKRSLADGENMRQRLNKQIKDAKTFGIQSFCKDLLEVADILSHATNSVPQDQINGQNPHLKNLYDGLLLTRNSLEQVFKRHGLEQIEAFNTKFDPNIHEALFQKVRLEWSHEFVSRSVLLN